MSTDRQLWDDRAPQTPAEELLDAKAWEHLGITGQEFRILWRGGHYRGDRRKAIAALEHLMRTGQWMPPPGPVGGFIR